MNLDNIKSIRFPGGEIHATLENENDNFIFAPIRNSEDVMKLLMVTDAFKRNFGYTPKLYLPYIPYARQDRVANQGEALSVKVFADLINTQNYPEITVLDPHSDVASALFNNIKIQHINDKFLSNLFHNCHGHYYKDFIVIAPDAGAYKKLSKLIKEVPVIQCTKERDTKTGKLSNLKIHTDIDLIGKELLVVDDICDGGGTFILLANELKKKGINNPITLYVSHGIFSKGLDELKIYYKNIYTTTSFTRKTMQDEFLKVWDLENTFFYKEGTVI